MLSTEAPRPCVSPSPAQASWSSIFACFAKSHNDTLYSTQGSCMHVSVQLLAASVIQPEAEVAMP